MVPFAAATAHRARITRYLAPAALVGVLATTVVVLMSPPGHLGTHQRATRLAHTSARPLLPTGRCIPATPTRTSPPKRG